MSKLNCKTTNWPNYATLDHQDAKNSYMFTKITPSRARMGKIR